MIKEISNIKEVYSLIKEVKGCLFVLGGVDSGKSTIIEEFCNEFKNNLSIGVISADLGQCLFGLPTCFSYSKFKTGNVKELIPEKMVFVGSSSPRSNLIRAISAFHKLLNYSSKTNEITLIDSDGMVMDSLGREYKLALIKMIEKGIIVAIQKKDELQHILKYLSLEINLPIFLAKVPDNIKNKSQQERAEYRFSRFNNYFQNKIEKVFHPKLENIIGPPFGIGKVMDQPALDVISKLFGIKVYYGEYGHSEFSIILEADTSSEEINRVVRELNVKKLNVFTPLYFKNLISCFSDNEGFARIITIIKEYDVKENKFSLILPYEQELNEFTFVLGQERINLD